MLCVLKQLIKSIGMICENVWLQFNSEITQMYDKHCLHFDATKAVHTDNFTRRAYRSRTVRVGLALQCEWSSGRVG